MQKLRSGNKFLVIFGMLLGLFSVTAMFLVEFMIILARGQPRDGCGKLEVVGEKLCSSGQHQLVRLLDGDLCDARDVRDLLLRPFVLRGLGGHVDGGRRHGDWRTSWHQVDVDGLLSDRRRRSLNVPGQPQGATEPVHEVARCDDLDVRIVGLQNELEAAADLLLAHR